MGRADIESVLTETVDVDRSPVHGIGLRNVIRRINLSTSGRGRVELESGTGGGLEVRILVPELSDRREP